MDKQYQISITPGSILMALVIGAVTYAVWVLRDLVLLVLTAIVIASAIEPGVVFCIRHRIPRVVAVLALYLAVFGTLFSVVYVFFPPILDETQGFLSSVPEYLDTFSPLSGGQAGALADLKSSGLEGNSFLTSLLEVRAAFSDTSAGSVRLLSTFFGGISSLVLVVVLSFYFAVQSTGVEDFIRVVTPARREEYVVSIWLRARAKIGLWMQGQLLSSLIGGILAYLGLVILGVPYALLLAGFTAFAMLIPVFGSVMAGVPAVVVAFSTGGFTLALIVAGLFFIINQFEAHLIHPLVVNKVVGIPPLLVILALIIGWDLAGFLGVVLAIPLAATLRELLNDFDKAKRTKPLS